MRKKLLGLLATMGVVASTAVLLAGSPADAARVANTGPVTFTFTQGSLAIGAQTFEASSDENPITATGTVNANGTISGITVSFPPLPPIEDVPVIGTVNPVINVLGTPSGSVNPLTGLSTMSFTVEIRIPELSSNCEVGPITLNASTANAGGAGYNPNDGSVTWADHTFSVPGAQGCSYLFASVDGQINSELGLPSPGGNNHATLSAVSTPILQRALVAAFTATPSSGFAPLATTLDASSTYHTRPILTHEWDLDGNGTFELNTGAVATTPAVFATPGVKNIGLRVTDIDGDQSQTTGTVTVLTPLPDVTIDKAGPAGIVAGDPGSFTIDVASEGQLPAVGATVVDTLPAGLTYSGATGAGWSCLEDPVQTVTCTSADVVAPGDAFPTLGIDVVADGSVIGSVTNSATVATTGEGDVADNADSASTLVVAPGIDLDIDKVHDTDEGLYFGENATYTITVANTGTLPAEDIVQVVDPLPAGTTFVGASGGFDWVCAYDPGTHTVGCFSLEDVAPGDSLDPINIVVDLDSVTSPLANTATVSVTGESNPANDSATDTGDVLGLAVDYAILKTHVGDVVVGEPTAYGIGVQNVGEQTGGGPVTVTDELAAGLTYVGAVGDSWTCGAVGQTVTCEHPGGVESGDVLPGITLQVVADDSLSGTSVDNTATVAGAGDANVANDSSTVGADVRRPEPDLAVSKGHEGNFTTGSDGTWTISVRNAGTERADGPTVVTDSLPAGVDFVSAGGTDWSCDSSALPQVTCTYAGVIDGLATAPPISIVAHAPDGAPDIVINGVTVANADDTNAGNDSAFDPTRIDRRAPAGTELEADAIVIKLKLGLGPKPIDLSLLNAPSAVLTSGGVPVPGKTVTFRTLNQHIVLCTAVTDANGVAKCAPTLQVLLQTLTAVRYTADFDGDVDFDAAHDEAAMIHLQTLKLL